MKIEPFVHRCVVEHGPLAGNKVFHEVTPYEAQSEAICEQCDEPLAPAAKLVAHIYEQLLEASDD